mmetsp:Transcript_17990/g.32684  ORF Transcript_17990/g.32684 Transcript_17990/m.32684 type:complete len:207 (+) Transcript_17990:455-1075(+)
MISENAWTIIIGIMRVHFNIDWHVFLLPTIRCPHIIAHGNRFGLRGGSLLFATLLLGFVLLFHVLGLIGCQSFRFRKNPLTVVVRLVVFKSFFVEISYVQPHVHLWSEISSQYIPRVIYLLNPDLLGRPFPSSYLPFPSSFIPFSSVFLPFPSGFLPFMANLLHQCSISKYGLRSVDLSPFWLYLVGIYRTICIKGRITRLRMGII